MNSHSAQPVKVRFARIRQWLAKPFIEEAVRSAYRKAKIALEKEQKKPWERTRQEEEVWPVAMIQAPPVINGIAGGEHWNGGIGTWSATYTHQPKPVRLVAPAPVQPPSSPIAHDWYPEQPQRHTDAFARLPIESGTTPLSPWSTGGIPRQQSTGAFLLDNRDTLFEDVPVSGEIEQNEDEDEDATVLHPRTRFRKAISHLQGE